jgi:anti-sigma factor RsiW
MNCDESREAIGQYVDGELDAKRRSELEEHLAGCEACSEVFRQAKQLQEDIRLNAPYYRAPSGLESSVRERLRDEAVGRSRVVSISPRWRSAAIAASVLLMLSLGWNVKEVRSRSGEGDLLAQEILSSHVRSLMGNHLMDVVSTDQHTVKPWFAGKLDFAPNVKDLSAEGFPLLGGRVEYIAGRSAAALVYGRRQHILNLFVWPSGTKEVETGEFERKGYHLVRWSDAQMSYWVASDVSMAELETFKALYGAQ